MSHRVIQGLADRPNFHPLSVASPRATIQGIDPEGREVPIAADVPQQNIIR